MVFNIFFTLFLVLLNGFFVAAEFAIVKVRSSRIDLLAEDGNNAAQMARKIIGKMDAYLSATQLGITIASLGLGWVGEGVVAQIIISLFSGLGLPLSNELAHQIALPVSFATITVLHIVFGELAPKSLAIQRSEATTLAVAYPLNLFYLLFRPIIWMLNSLANFILRLMGIQPAAEHEVHSPEELRYLVEQGSESGDVEKVNYDIIKNAFDFTERIARQVMVPRTQVAALDVEADEAEIEKMIEEGYSRIPVYKETIDDIVGILYVKDLLIALRKQPTVSVRNLMRPALFVPGSKKISDLLADLQKKRVHMAVVVNEYGGTEGIISMEDIMEEIVGEIQDEYDTETPIVEKVNEDTYSVAGNASIVDINEYLPEPLPESKEYESIGGLLIAHLERIPNQHEKVRIEGYDLTVLKKQQNNIVQVQLDRVREDEEDE